MGQFTEFCCKSTGSNLNAGTLNGDSTEPGASPTKTYASGTWVQSTRVFTPAAGNPVTDGIAVGNFASVYPDGTTGDAVYLGRVSAVSSTTITIDGTANCGTAPVNGTSNTTLVIGGAWKGPNAASGFPLSFVTNALKNAAGNYPRLNLKSDAQYNINTMITVANSPYVTVQGYAASYGDFGMCIIDGGAPASAFTLVSNPVTQARVYRDLILQNNGTGGFDHTHMFDAGEGTAVCVRMVCRNSWAMCFQAPMLSVECEAYNALQGLTGSGWGNGAGNCFYCIAHDIYGIAAWHGGTTVVNCIAANCTGNGAVAHGNQAATCINCDVYNCTGDGFQAQYAVNCNALKTGGWGFNPARDAGYLTCRGGSGSQVNTGGLINPNNGYDQSDVSTYATNLTPWVDPTIGNFTIALAAAKGAGRSVFMQTAPSYAGSVGHPDIGAAIHNPVGGGLIVDTGMCGGME